MNQVRDIIRQLRPKIFWGMRFLSKAKQTALYTFYAFFQNIEDIVNQNISQKEKADLINAWKAEIENIFNNQKTPQTELGRLIYKNCMRFNIPQEQFLRLINSIEMNIPQPINCPKLEDLYQYCKGISGTHSNVFLRIWGIKDENVIKNLSEEMGIALQLTNILRKTKEDAGKNRIYIPQEFLSAAGVESRLPQEIIVSNKLDVAREKLGKVAFEHLSKAENIIKKMDKHTQKPLKITCDVYKKYLDIMQKRGWEVISPEPNIRFKDKIYIVCKNIIKK